jgi:hypothetical protein
MPRRPFSVLVKGADMQALHNRNSRSLRALAPLALIAGAVMGAHGSAAAAPLTTVNGNTCKPYGNSATSGLYSYTNSVYNGSGAGMYVTCPVVRTVNALSTGYYVWVDGNAGSGTTTCSLYSYNFNGSYIGGVSFSATGVFDKTLMLTQAQVPTYSSQSLLCYVPAGGSMYDVEPVQ